ncbi:leucine-rich repeat extensin-like protein 3 [Homarus americanus]|nr:leucine-rich repeat extensin-like protein 3 [Homarus americanus]
MALCVLTLVALVGATCASSVSHVSIRLGDRAPITYEVSPDAAPHRPPPTRQYPALAPAYPTPPPTRYTTAAPTPSRIAYTPPALTYPTPTTPDTPIYPPPITPARATYPPPTTPAPATYPLPTNPAPATYPPPITPAPSTYAPTTSQEPTTYASPPTTKASIYHPQPYYQPRPAYHPKPVYRPAPSYNPAPSYHPAPSYKHPEPAVPACADLTNSTWCLEDEAYPEYEIKHAIQYHLDKFNSLYADVAELDAELSVERPNTLEEETYLCPSETSYIRPLRAQNTDGKWRVIVNNINVHYKTFTQTTRVEECLTAGDDCPKVPVCYESKCLQKSIYHRFLVYDSYDQYFPFAIETFKLPASCACLLGAYTIDH